MGSPKFAIPLVMALAALLPGPAMAQYSTDGTRAAYDREIGQLSADLEAKKIGELSFAEAAAEAARRYYPENYAFISVREYKVMLAQRLEQGAISREEYDRLWNMKRIQFNTRREAEIQRAQIERDAQALAAEQQSRDLNTGLILQGIGNTFRRSVTPNPVNCVSTPVGASVSTRCY